MTVEYANRLWIMAFLRSPLLTVPPESIANPPTKELMSELKDGPRDHLKWRQKNPTSDF